VVTPIKLSVTGNLIDFYFRQHVRGDTNKIELFRTQAEIYGNMISRKKKPQAHLFEKMKSFSGSRPMEVFCKLTVPHLPGSLN